MQSTEEAHAPDQFRLCCCSVDSTEWEVVDITALDVAKEGGRAYYE